MGLKEIVVRKPANLMVVDGKESIFTEIPNVKYALVASSRYSFEYRVNEDIDVNMFESDRTFDSNEFVDAEYETAVSEKDYSYYAVAVASGVLTGVFSQLKLSEENLKKIDEWKEKDWDKYIVIVAQMAGYKKSDIKGAKKFLKNRFVPFVDEELKREYQEGLDKWVNAISSHPTVAGLTFSIFTQFSGEKYWLGEKGIEKEAVSEYYAIGRNTVEKIVYGLLYWVFDLSIDVALSEIALLEEMKIPKEVSKVLKELLKLPIFEKIPRDYKDAEKIYSEWIQKIFENSECQDDDGEVGTFDLHEMIESLNRKAFSERTPVIINECIVRSFYFIKKLIIEVKEKEIRSLNELDQVDPANVLPFNNRLTSRMILISSGCFVGINVAGATLKAIAKENKDEGAFAETLLTEVSGNTQNVIMATGVTGAAALLSGGLAFAFAPGIATLIAGEAVVGLHGAALTSASLAIVGGGSLAAGGMGMAGGTAIITGGGALLGIAGSGSASMAAILSQTSSDYWVRQTTKLLTFCNCVLKDRINDTESINGLINEINQTIKKVELNIKELEAEDCSLDKVVIKNSKDCLKYLNRDNTELKKIIK